MDCSLPGSSVHGISHARIIMPFVNLELSFEAPTTSWSLAGSFLLQKVYPSGSMASLILSFTWRRKWQPTPVFLPGEFHGQRSLAGNSPWDRKSQTRLSNPTSWVWSHHHSHLRAALFIFMSVLRTRPLVPWQAELDLIHPVSFMSSTRLGTEYPFTKSVLAHNPGTV